MGPFIFDKLLGRAFTNVSKKERVEKIRTNFEYLMDFMCSLFIFVYEYHNFWFLFGKFFKPQNCFKVLSEQQFNNFSKLIWEIMPTI